MLRISPDQVTLEIVSILDLTLPTAIRALAVLAGGNAGRIYVDVYPHPNWVLVWETDDGVLDPGGVIIEG